MYITTTLDNKYLIVYLHNWFMYDRDVVLHNWSSETCAYSVTRVKITKLKSKSKSIYKMMLVE